MCSAAAAGKQEGPRVPAERLRAVPAEDGGRWSKPAADVYKNKVRQKGAQVFTFGSRTLVSHPFVLGVPGTKPRASRGEGKLCTLGFRIQVKKKSLQMPAGVQPAGRADTVDSNDRIPFLEQQMDDPVWHTLYSECSERLCWVRVKAGLYTCCSHLGFEGWVILKLVHPQTLKFPILSSESIICLDPRGVGRWWTSSWASDSIWHWISQQGLTNWRITGRAA